jgi:hypothetical protein
MRQWNAGEGSGGGPGGDTGHDFVGNTRFPQGLGLFAAAGKEKWIAALQPDDSLPQAGGRDHGLMDLRKQLRLTPMKMRDTQAFGTGRGVIQ